MTRRHALEVGALSWAAAGAVVALSALSGVNADARVVVGAASILGPLAAIGASRLLVRGSDRAAGSLLLVSVLTPTYFFWILNVSALVVGLALVAVPRRMLAIRRV